MNKFLMSTNKHSTESVKLRIFSISSLINWPRIVVTSERMSLLRNLSLIVQIHPHPNQNPMKKSTPEDVNHHPQIPKNLMKEARISVAMTAMKVRRIAVSCN